MDNVTVLKVGGAELQDGPLLDDLVEVLERLARERVLVVVHGGGSEIADLQQRLGLQPAFVDGLRVTDRDSLNVAQMVLSGLVNKRLVGRLADRGVRALGLSGMDAGLLRAHRLSHPKGDLGFVGEIMCVETCCLVDLIKAGFTPIVSPISLGEGGCAYNVNADHAAVAIAGALAASELVFITDVPGVQREGQVLPLLSRDEAEKAIAEGVINGGMIPKVRAALEAVTEGAKRVRIVNLEGMFAQGGTVVVP